MTYTPIQLEIIKTFGKKDVTFGCLYLHNGTLHTCDSGNYRLKYNGCSYHLYIDAFCNCPREISKIYNEYKDEGIVEILGHIPEIFPDVAILAEERGWLLEIKFGLLTIHFKDRTFTSCKYNTILPLLEQPESVLIQILNLFK